MLTLRYHRPALLSDLYEQLARESAPVLWIAGATDVLVQGRADERFASHAAYDLSALPGLRAISEDENNLLVGSTATFSQIMGDPLIRQYAPLLCEAVSKAGAVQLRNRATIGGNVANASPAADSLAALAVLDAEVGLDYMGERSFVPLSSFILAPGKTALRERVFIYAFRIPKLQPDMVFGFEKVGRRNALAISRLTVAGLASFDSANTVKDLRIAVGAVFGKPMRFPEIESMAQGRRLEDALIADIARKQAEKIPELAGRRASTQYKQPVCYHIIQSMLEKMRDNHGN